MKAMKEQLATQLQQEQQRGTDQQRQLQTNEAMKKQLEGQLQEKQKQVAELQRQLETNQQEMTTMAGYMEVGLREKQQQVTELQSQLETKEEEMTAKREQVNKYQGRARLLQREKQRVETNKQEMTTMREPLEGQSRQVTEPREQLTQTKQQLRSVLSAYRREHPPDWVISRNDVQNTGQELGRGAWGTVFRGKFHGCVVAIKEIHENIMSDNSRRLFEREVDIASKCRHPCLLQFIGATINEERPLLVTEIMDCSLKVKLQNEPPLSVTGVCVILLDVARALNYLHQKQPVPIVHRDVSSANVLLWRQDNQWRAKLSDYGTANFVRQSNINYAGAVIYSAPESLKEDPDQPISCKVDVFSFGVLLCESCIRKQPDPLMRKHQIARMKHRKFQTLVKSCVVEEPWKRPDMELVIVELEKVASQQCSLPLL